jgi:3-methyl-2-oxobutanoate hydroxymethyltransferase
MSAPTNAVRRLTVADIAKMHAAGERIPMLTAYDFPTAKLLDEAGIPFILVGDSVGTVMLGYDSEIRVTMADMLHHTAAVVRGTERALIVGDMPFLSYATPEEGVDNAGRFLQVAGAQAVKVEGGVRTARVIEAIVKAGIPVMGHIGWTPQSKHGLGGKVGVQGKSGDRARSLIADALAVQEAGAFSIVLELVPEQLAGALTERLRIPTIGIGAGPLCSGQVQVLTDLLGMADWHPKHSRPFANLREEILGAARTYAEEVGAGRFPAAEQTVRMDDAVLDQVLGRSHLDQAGTGSEAAPASAASTARSGIPLDRDL